MIAPGSSIGIIGGGQLGRMLAVAAAQLGYRCHVLDPNEDGPAAQVAHRFTRAAFDDCDALRIFAEAVDVATYEFENLPVAALQVVGDKLRPGTKSLEIAQDRGTEKHFIERCNAQVAPWRAVASADDVLSTVEELGTPIVVKTRRYGYDGKGQAWIHSLDEALAGWEAIGREPAVAEAGIDFLAEFSVIVGRWADGRHCFWDSAENEHRDGILRRSIVPSSSAVTIHLAQARKAALAIAEALGHIGVLTVEFFATADGPIVNEIAPRVHNSGHWTIEGAVTSQFQQHIRAICNLPPGSTELAGSAATMDNLIGDDVNGWADLVADPRAHVHLYGKGDPRPGRKMGHVTRVVI